MHLTLTPTPTSTQLSTDLQSYEPTDIDIAIIKQLTEAGGRHCTYSGDLPGLVAIIQKRMRQPFLTPDSILEALSRLIDVGIITWSDKPDPASTKRLLAIQPASTKPPRPRRGDTTQYRIVVGDPGPEAEGRLARTAQRIAAENRLRSYTDDGLDSLSTDELAQLLLEVQPDALTEVFSDPNLQGCLDHKPRFGGKFRLIKPSDGSPELSFVVDRVLCPGCRGWCYEPKLVVGRTPDSSCS